MTRQNQYGQCHIGSLVWIKNFMFPNSWIRIIKSLADMFAHSNQTILFFPKWKIKTQKPCEKKIFKKFPWPLMKLFFF